MKNANGRKMTIAYSFPTDDGQHEHLCWDPDTSTFCMVQELTIEGTLRWFADHMGRSIYTGKPGFPRDGFRQWINLLRDRIEKAEEFEDEVKELREQIQQPKTQQTEKADNSSVVNLSVAEPGGAR